MRFLPAGALGAILLASASFSCEPPSATDSLQGSSSSSGGTGGGGGSSTSSSGGTGGGGGSSTSSSGGTGGGGGSSTSSSGGTGGGGGSSTSSSGGTGGGGGSPETPSGRLLLTSERLAELKLLAEAKDPSFVALRSLVDSHVGSTTDLWHDSPENMALVFLLTGQTKYAEAAYAWEKALIDGVNVRGDSYLEFGELMRHAAIVLDWCREALSAGQRATLADYLERWTEELWFANQGSGWGLADPGNNYHQAFLEGTAYAAIALAHEGRPSASKFRDVLNARLAAPGGQLEYLATEADGGDWREGANYGERAKQRLFSAFAAIAADGGPNYFREVPWVSEALRFALYQLQPDRVSLAPSGDLARDSAMTITAADRDYVQTAAAWLEDGPVRRLARGYLDAVAPPFTNPYAGLAYKNLVFRVPGPSLQPTGLPLGYVAGGSGFVHWRSSWETSATSVTLSAPPVIDQSHQHHDAGSFVIFHRGWLAMDASTLSKTGLDWSPGAHNGIHVAGAEQRGGALGGLLRHEDDGVIAYAAVDATAQYRTKSSLLMNEVTRELVFARPGLVLVYDRTEAKSATAAVEWRLHLPKAPTLGQPVTIAANGAGLSLAPLVAGAVSVASDSDLEGGASSAWRVAEASSGQTMRFLNAIAVGDGSAPPLSAARVVASGAIEGVEAGGVVAVFSRLPFGQPAALPFSYAVNGTLPRRHVIANVAGGVAVAVVKKDGTTTVTVSPGNAHQASLAGTVSFVE